MAFVVDTISGVPNEDLPDVIAAIQLNPRYVDHLVVSEGGGTSFIAVVLHAPGTDQPDLLADEAKPKKKKTRKKSG